MKKVFMTLAAVLMGMTAANAQVVLGGSIEFGAGSYQGLYSIQTSTTTKSSIYGITDKDPQGFSFAIAPKVGYMFLDGKMEAGAALLFNYGQQTDYVLLYSEVEKEKDGVKYKDYVDGKASKNTLTQRFNWSINPYVRGRIAAGKGFGLWLEGVVTLGNTMDEKVKKYAYSGFDEDGEKIERTQESINKEKEEQDKYNKENSIKDGNFTGGLTIKPVVTYDINDHWRLEAGLKFLELGIEGSVYTHQEKNENGDIEKTTTNQCTFVLGAWGNRVYNASWFNIGCAYKF